VLDLYTPTHIIHLITDVVCVMTDKKDKINCFSKKDASPDQIELPEVNPRESENFLYLL